MAKSQAAKAMRTQKNTVKVKDAQKEKPAGPSKSSAVSEYPEWLYRIFNPTILMILAAAVGLNHFAICQLYYYVDIEAYQSIEIYLCGIVAAHALMTYIINNWKIRFKAEYWILAGLMVWYFLSCAVMTSLLQKDWLMYNKKALIDAGITMLVFFPLGAALGKGSKKAQKNTCVVIHVIILIWTLFILYALINVFQMRVVRVPNGGQIGMTKRAALSLSCYYNTTGAWEMLFFLGCVYMGCRTRFVWLKIFDCLAAAIHMIALTLSNSRTSFAATAVGFAGIMFIEAYRFIDYITKGKLLQRKAFGYLISAAVAVICGAAFLYLRRIIYDVFHSVTHFNELIGGTEDTMVREMINSTTSTLSGRTTIWIGALKGMFSTGQRFFFGVTPAGVNSLISLMTDGEYNMYTHNQFLEMGVALGVPGMLAFIVWFILILKSGVKFIKKGVNEEWITVVMILALMVANMAEATLLFYQFITGLAFFFICGWLYGRATDLKG